MWGPAWVAWRSGGGWYVGWAALPPRGVSVTATYGHRSPWRFTRAADLGAARPRCLPMRDTRGMFHRTTNVANDRVLTRGNATVHINAGPRYIPNAMPAPAEGGRASGVPAAGDPSPPRRQHVGAPVDSAPPAPGAGSGTATRRRTAARVSAAARRWAAARVRAAARRSAAARRWAAARAWRLDTPPGAIFPGTRPRLLRLQRRRTSTTHPGRSGRRRAASTARGRAPSGRRRTETLSRSRQHRAAHHRGGTRQQPAARQQHARDLRRAEQLRRSRPATIRRASTIRRREPSRRRPR